MHTKNEIHQAYLQILKTELVPAMGCTEPISIAYCAANARALPGELPCKVDIKAGGNIIKNVKSVIVPHTNNSKGIQAAAAIGILAGKEQLGLEVLSDVTEQQAGQVQSYLQRTEFSLAPAQSDFLPDISVRVFSENGSACVRVANQHTNIVYKEKTAKSC